MNEVMKTILARRSARRFEEREIPSEILEQIVNAAFYAPSGQGKQTWHFSVVTDRAKIQTLAALVAEQLGKPAYDFYAPQVLIITSNKRDNRHGPEDNACAMENIFLAAASFGIGSCWINQLSRLGDEPQIRSLLRQWGVPDDHALYGAAALGYPAPGATREVERVGQVTYIR